MKTTKENENQFADIAIEEQLKNVSGGEDTSSLRFNGKPVPLPKADSYKH